MAALIRPPNRSLSDYGLPLSGYKARKRVTADGRLNLDDRQPCAASCPRSIERTWPETAHAINASGNTKSRPRDYWQIASTNIVRVRRGYGPGGTIVHRLSTVVTICAKPSALRMNGEANFTELLTLFKAIEGLVNPLHGVR